MTITLSDLPVEIFHHIVDELPKYKLSNADTAIPRPWYLREFRLVSRTIETKTRARFAHEFFASLAITVPLRPSERLQHISGDAILRDSVRNVKIHIRFPYELAIQDSDMEPGHDKNHEKTLEDFLVKCSLTSSFGQFLKAIHCLKSLTVSTQLDPRYPALEHMSTMCKGYNRMLWRIMAREVLKTVLLVESIRLENIQLGEHWVNQTEIPPSFLGDLPETSTNLSELTSLRLVGFVDGEHHLGSTLPFGTLYKPQDLFNFLARAPKLRKLEYSGLQDNCNMESSLVEDYRLLRSLTLPSTVTNLSLSNLTIAEHVPHFGDSLKVLRLDFILVVDMEWRLVFSVLRKSLDLDIFEAKNLEEGNNLLTFDLIHHDRPITVSHNIEVQRWDEGWWDRPTEVTANEDDDWLWVEHDCMIYDISLSTQDGDDMDEWLLKLEERYELVDLSLE
jgi:hypothetical protein